MDAPKSETKSIQNIRYKYMCDLRRDRKAKFPPGRGSRNVYLKLFEELMMPSIPLQRTQCENLRTPTDACLNTAIPTNEVLQTSQKENRQKSPVRLNNTPTHISLHIRSAVPVKSYTASDVTDIKKHSTVISSAKRESPVHSNVSSPIQNPALSRKDTLIKSELVSQVVSSSLNSACDVNEPRKLFGIAELNKCETSSIIQNAIKIGKACDMKPTVPKSKRPNNSAYSKIYKFIKKTPHKHLQARMVSPSKRKTNVGKKIKFDKPSPVMASPGIRKHLKLSPSLKCIERTPPTTPSQSAKCSNGLSTPECPASDNTNGSEYKGSAQSCSDTLSSFQLSLTFNEVDHTQTSLDEGDVVKGYMCSPHHLNSGPSSPLPGQTCPSNIPPQLPASEFEPQNNEISTDTFYKCDKLDEGKPKQKPISPPEIPKSSIEGSLCSESKTEIDEQSEMMKRNSESNLKIRDLEISKNDDSDSPVVEIEFTELPDISDESDTSEDTICTKSCIMDFQSSMETHDSFKSVIDTVDSAKSNMKRKLSTETNCSSASTIGMPLSPESNVDMMDISEHFVDDKTDVDESLTDEYSESSSTFVHDSKPTTKVHTEDVQQECTCGDNTVSSTQMDCYNETYSTSNITIKSENNINIKASGYDKTTEQTNCNTDKEHVDSSGQIPDVKVDTSRKTALEIAQEIVNEHTQSPRSKLLSSDIGECNSPSSGSVGSDTSQTTRGQTIPKLNFKTKLVKALRGVKQRMCDNNMDKTNESQSHKIDDDVRGVMDEVLGNLEKPSIDSLYDSDNVVRVVMDTILDDICDTYYSEKEEEMATEMATENSQCGVSHTLMNPDDEQSDAHAPRENTLSVQMDHINEDDCATDLTPQRKRAIDYASENQSNSDGAEPDKDKIHVDVSSQMDAHKVVTHSTEESPESVDVEEYISESKDMHQADIPNASLDLGSSGLNEVVEHITIEPAETICETDFITESDNIHQADVPYICMDVGSEVEVNDTSTCVANEPLETGCDPDHISGSDNIDQADVASVSVDVGSDVTVNAAVAHATDESPKSVCEPNQIPEPLDAHQTDIPNTFQPSTSETIRMDCSPRTDVRETFKTDDHEASMYNTSEESETIPWQTHRHMESLESSYNEAEIIESNESVQSSMKDDCGMNTNDADINSNCQSLRDEDSCDSTDRLQIDEYPSTKQASSQIDEDNSSGLQLCCGSQRTYFRKKPKKVKRKKHKLSMPKRRTPKRKELRIVPKLRLISTESIQSTDDKSSLEVIGSKHFIVKMDEEKQAGRIEEDGNEHLQSDMLLIPQVVPDVQDVQQTEIPCVTQVNDRPTRTRKRKIKFSEEDVFAKKKKLSRSPKQQDSSANKTNQSVEECQQSPNATIAEVHDDRLSREFSKHNWILEKYRELLCKNEMETTSPPDVTNNKKSKKEKSKPKKKKKKLINTSDIFEPQTPITEAATIEATPDVIETYLQQEETEMIEIAENQETEYSSDSESGNLKILEVVSLAAFIKDDENHDLAPCIVQPYSNDTTVQNPDTDVNTERSEYDAVHPVISKNELNEPILTPDVHNNDDKVLPISEQPPIIYEEETLDLSVKSLTSKLTAANEVGHSQHPSIMRQPFITDMPSDCESYHSTQSVVKIEEDCMAHPSQTFTSIDNIALDEKPLDLRVSSVSNQAIDLSIKSTKEAPTTVTESAYSCFNIHVAKLEDNSVSEIPKQPTTKAVIPCSARGDLPSSASAPLLDSMDIKPCMPISSNQQRSQSADTNPSVEKPLADETVSHHKFSEAPKFNELRRPSSETTGIGQPQHSPMVGSTIDQQYFSSQFLNKSPYELQNKGIALRQQSSSHLINSTHQSDLNSEYREKNMVTPPDRIIYSREGSSLSMVKSEQSSVNSSASANKTAPSAATTNRTAPSPTTANITAPLPALTSRTAPSPALTNITAPLPALTNRTAPSPASTNRTAPSPASTIRTAPSPASTNRTDSSPATTNRTAPSPASTNITAPSPATTNRTAPSPVSANRTAPSPASANRTAPSPGSTNRTAPSPATTNRTAPSPGSTNRTAPSPASANRTAASPAITSRTAPPVPAFHSAMPAMNEQFPVSISMGPRTIRPVLNHAVRAPNMLPTIMRTVPSNVESSQRPQIQPMMNVQRLTLPQQIAVARNSHHQNIPQSTVINKTYDQPLLRATSTNFQIPGNNANAMYPSSQAQKPIDNHQRLVQHRPMLVRQPSLPNQPYQLQMAQMNRPEYQQQPLGPPILPIHGRFKDFQAIQPKQVNAEQQNLVRPAQPNVIRPTPSNIATHPAQQNMTQPAHKLQGYQAVASRIPMPQHSQPRPGNLQKVIPLPNHFAQRLPEMTQQFHNPPRAQYPLVRHQIPPRGVPQARVQAPYIAPPSVSSGPPMNNGSAGMQIAQINCGACSKKANFLCSGCKRVAYCTPECQHQSWKTHKDRCYR